MPSNSANRFLRCHKGGSGEDPVKSWKGTHAHSEVATHPRQVIRNPDRSSPPYETQKHLKRRSSCRLCLKMAERQGFEPWRRSPAYTLSRRAPSTTRPPVRGAWCSVKQRRFAIPPPGFLQAPVLPFSGQNAPILHRSDEPLKPRECSGSSASPADPVPATCKRCRQRHW